MIVLARSVDDRDIEVEHRHVGAVACVIVLARLVEMSSVIVLARSVEDRDAYLRYQPPYRQPVTVLARLVDDRDHQIHALIAPRACGTCSVG